MAGIVCHGDTETQPRARRHGGQPGLVNRCPHRLVSASSDATAREYRSHRLKGSRIVTGLDGCGRRRGERESIGQNQVRSALHGLAASEAQMSSWLLRENTCRLAKASGAKTTFLSPK